MGRPPLIRHEVKQPLDDSVKLIPLTMGKNAIVDAVDYEELSTHNWCAKWNGYNEDYYAIRNAGVLPNNKRISMHRHILNISDMRIVDHINGDTLDNRRNNLRICTHQQNLFNSKRNIKNTSGYKGVSLSKGKWSVRYRDDGRYKYGGSFTEKNDAAQFYILITYLKRGEFARSI